MIERDEGFKIKELNQRLVNKSVKIILIIGISMVVYGFLSRALGIDFFWESSTLGWAFILAGLFLLLVRRVKMKRSANRKTIWERIGIGALLLLSIVMVIVTIVIANSNALVAAKTYILNSDSLKREMGEIRGFGFTYSGGMEVSSDAAGETGTAEISLIVKGAKKFKELDVYVLKERDRGWEVKGIQ
jgi:hypothetical protein